MAEEWIGEVLRRTRRDSIDVALRWARASTTAPLGMWWHRTLHVAHRRLDDWEADPVPVTDRPLPGDPGTVQSVDDGVGPLHRRRYEVRIETDATPADVLATLPEDLDAGTPDLFVRFLDADRRAPSRLEVGDELMARLTGPVDGPVRVAVVEPTRVVLATLTGHAEAGLIRFTTAQDGHGNVQFAVTSWARSSTPLVRWLYERGGGRDVQAHVWTHLCLALAQRHGRPVGRVVVADRVDPWPLESSPLEPGPLEDGGG